MNALLENFLAVVLALSTSVLLFPQAAPPLAQESRRPILSLPAKGAKMPDQVELPRLSDFDFARQPAAGVTLDITLHLPAKLSKGCHLLQSIAPDSGGIQLEITSLGGINVYFTDGRSSVRVESQPGAVVGGKPHRVLVVLRALTGKVEMLVDGVAAHVHSKDRQPKGATPRLKDVRGATSMYINNNRIRSLRLYDRALDSSELVGNRGSARKQ